MKKTYLIALAIILVIIQIIFVVYSYNQDNSIKLSNDYLAVFRGETGEKVNSTYLYVKKKGKKKTYKYINTVSTLSGYDSTNWDTKITKKGTLKKKKDIYKKAKEHDAYSYVKYEDGKIYTIDEFKGMFR